MKIKKATKRYEQWLSAHMAIVQGDLELKHRMMTESLFPFLRATFYRWMQLWPQACPDANRAPVVLAVGDLHVENFGTWRDIEGRLVWGVNDFDEAYPLPYTIDLVRLATSAHMAIAAGHLAVDPKDACAAFLRGYMDCLAAGGRPFVMAEDHAWLGKTAMSELRDPVRFWKKIDNLPTVKKAVPLSAIEAMEHLMPEHGLTYRIAHRVAGLGSLGRPRFVAIADWRGGKVTREAKALLPSACLWANGGKGPREIFYQTLINRAVRCRDPFVQFRDRWIVRRLAPDCSRIELASLPKRRDETRLLHAMGWETANIHLGSKEAIKDVRHDLKKRGSGWLHKTSTAMLSATTSDWNNWKRK